MKKIILFSFLLSCLFVTKLFSQSSIQTSAGDTYSDAGSFSYTIGSTMYSNFSGNEGFVTEGIQQPFEIYAVNYIEPPQGISLACFAYPNPVKDMLILKIENYALENLSFELFDITGKLLISNDIQNEKTSISTANLINSLYILKVIQKEKVIQTFKIIKTK